MAPRLTLKGLYTWSDWIEVFTASSAAAGERHKHLSSHVGEVAGPNGANGLGENIKH